MIIQCDKNSKFTSMDPSPPSLLVPRPYSRKVLG